MDGMTQEQLLAEIGTLHVVLKRTLTEKAQLQQTVVALKKKLDEALERTAAQEVT